MHISMACASRLCVPCAVGINRDSRVHPAALQIPVEFSLLAALHARKATIDGFSQRLYDLFKTGRLANNALASQTEDAEVASSSPANTRPQQGRACGSVYKKAGMQQPQQEVQVLPVSPPASKAAAGVGGMRQMLASLVARVEHNAAETARDISDAPSESKLYCVCRMPHADGVFMVACDGCDEW